MLSQLISFLHQSSNAGGLGSTGDIDMSTGNANVGKTGSIRIETGTSSRGKSGEITMSVGKGNQLKTRIRLSRFSLFKRISLNGRVHGLNGFGLS